VPAAVDRVLAEMAIEHMVRVNRPGLRQRPRVARVIAWANGTARLFNSPPIAEGRDSRHTKTLFLHCEGQIGLPTVDCSARVKRIHHG
jgi:hypothetical protein